MKRPLRDLLRWAGLGLVVLFAIVILAAVAISFQGRQKLAKVRGELLAKGEKLTWSELAPRPVPDDQNVVADPIWKAPPNLSKNQETPWKEAPVFQLNSPLAEKERREFAKLFGADDMGDWLGVAWNSDLSDRKASREQANWILAAIAPYDPVLDRVHELLKRPSLRFGQNSDIYKNEAYSFGGGCLDVGKALSLRALANLALDNTDAAARDITDLLSLVEKMGNQSLLYMEMLRLGIAARVPSLIRAGISEHQWSAEQLVKFEAALRPIDFVAGIAQAFRGERGVRNQIIEEVRTGSRTVGDAHIIPDGKGWPYGNALVYACHTVFGPGDHAALNLDIQQIVEMLDRSREDGAQRIQIGAMLKTHNPITECLCCSFLYQLGGNIDVAVMEQTQLDQTRIACALESCRIKHGAYPQSLSALVPDNIPQLLVDRFSLALMKYQLTSADRFELSARSGEDTITWKN